jgi:hypothetical protein
VSVPEILLSVAGDDGLSFLHKERTVLVSREIREDETKPNMLTNPPWVAGTLSRRGQLEDVEDIEEDLTIPGFSSSENIPEPTPVLEVGPMAPPARPAPKNSLFSQRSAMPFPAPVGVPTIALKIAPITPISHYSSTPSYPKPLSNNTTLPLRKAQIVIRRG